MVIIPILIPEDNTPAPLWLWVLVVLVTVGTLAFFGWMVWDDWRRGRD